MDTRHLTKGARLFLPVEVAGALFSLGDGHAAQGDGEVCGTAIETPMHATVRLTVRKDKPVSSPQFLTSGPLITRTNTALMISAKRSIIRSRSIRHARATSPFPISAVSRGFHSVMPMRRSVSAIAPTCSFMRWMVASRRANRRMSVSLDRSPISVLVSAGDLRSIAAHRED